MTFVAEHPFLFLGPFDRCMSGIIDLFSLDRWIVLNNILYVLFVHTCVWSMGRHSNFQAFIHGYVFKKNKIKDR